MKKILLITILGMSILFASNGKSTESAEVKKMTQDEKIKKQESMMDRMKSSSMKCGSSKCGSVAKPQRSTPKCGAVAIPTH